jgi:2-oxoisovalerate dehydrogenase E1 component
VQKNKLTPNFNWHRWKSDKKDKYSMEPLLAARILFYIYVIHEFEHALLRLKNDDCIWGPVHTSVGQEGIAAASVTALRKTDKFVATHRSHHQFLGKALHFVLPNSWNPINEDLPEIGKEVIRRTFAEIMGLFNGYCGGRGGSMHLRYKEAGFLGSNAIVGGGIPLATGAAFAEKFNNSGNIVVCFFGDGATNQGSFHEACNLAGLWNLPIIFFLENNEYAVATHKDKACAVKELSIRASSYGMDGHVIDGNDPFVIYQIMKKVAEKIRKGNRPCLIEAKCYRRYHHAGDQLGSFFRYRSREEEEARKQKEVVIQFPMQLVSLGLMTGRMCDQVKELAVNTVFNVVSELTLPGTPRKVRKELYPSPATINDGLRSDGQEWKNIVFNEREHFSSFKDIRYSDAIAAVTGRWLEKNNKTIVLGEEVANFRGGAYGATKGLPNKYPDRVLNTPISEAGFVGLSLGAAISGMHPIVEIMFGDFALVAADQIFNQISKARYMYGNTTNLPLVIRTRIAAGCGYGGQHSMDPIGLYALFPGLRIVAPANAFDYVGLFNSAMHSLDPVVILEHQALYNVKTKVPLNDLDYFIELGKARTIANGEDVTLITYSSLVPRCEKLLPRLEEAGISAELIDLRTLDYPSIDYSTIAESVKKTGAAVIVEEAAKSISIGPILANRISENYFDYLDSPIACLTSLDIPLPVSRPLEAAALLDDEMIIKTTIDVAKRQRR